MTATGPTAVAGFDAAVAAWVAGRLGLEADDFGPCTAIGVVLGGELVAGCVFGAYRPWVPSIEASIAAVTPAWCTRAVLGALFAYPFGQLGVGRLQATTRRDNRRARRFLERLGFSHEGIGRRAWAGGADACVYAMLKEECRWIHEESPAAA